MAYLFSFILLEIKIDLQSVRLDSIGCFEHYIKSLFEAVKKKWHNLNSDFRQNHFMV
jgi:hypothetical protein